MTGNDVRDFAKDVKGFYERTAFSCEHLMKQGLTGESYTIGCAAIDGLSFIWKELEKPQKANPNRFISFLLYFNSDQVLSRVGIPFLYYYLEKKGIGTAFKDELKQKWLLQRKEHQSHKVYCDPFIDEVKQLYLTYSKDQTTEADIKLAHFTYAGLIYHYYRCPLVHENRSSNYAIHFNKNGGLISVREIAADIVAPDNKVVLRHEIVPQLDVGIGVFTEAIRRGSELIHDSILRQGVTEIPHSKQHEIKDRLFNFL